MGEEDGRKDWSMTLYPGEMKGLARPDASRASAPHTAMAHTSGLSVLRSLYRTVASVHPAHVAASQAMAQATQHKTFAAWK